MSRKKIPRLLKGYTHHNKVRLVHGGKDFFDTIIRLIDDARSMIQLQTYIFDADETGRMVSAALLRAVERKVQVYILLDGYASQHLSRQLIEEWKAAGIRFRWFWPLFRSRRFLSWQAAASQGDRGGCGKRDGRRGKYQRQVQ